jgi:hypothetical protein
LVKCPPGYILVRTADKPNMDECAPCIPQTYSLEEATYSYKTGVGYLNSDNAAKVVLKAPPHLCLQCPPGATCNGAEKVDPKGNFWIASSMMCPENACDPRNGLCEATRCYNWSTATTRRRSSSSSSSSECTDDAPCRVRSFVYRCPQGFCPLANSTCKAGHHGPLCALCDEGWAMSVRGCEKCIDLGAWPQVLLAAVLVFIVWILYLFSWRPLLRKHCDACNYMGTCTSCIKATLRSKRLSFFAKALSALKAGLTSASTAGYFKIILSFWQLTGTYNFVYNVDWPKELTELWTLLSSFLQIDILDIPTVCSSVHSSFIPAQLYVVSSPPCLCTEIKWAHNTYSSLGRLAIIVTNGICIMIEYIHTRSFRASPAGSHTASSWCFQCC